MPIVDGLLQIIRDTAATIPTFNFRLGPGGGDKGNAATQAFVKAVNQAVRQRWPSEVEINKPAILSARFDFDFYVASEETAVEIALSIRNPVSEYEKDILKALMAKDAGLPLQRLILIGKEGSLQTRNAPGPSAIRAWAKKAFDLSVEVHEIIGVASEKLGA